MRFKETKMNHNTQQLFLLELLKQPSAAHAAFEILTTHRSLPYRDREELEELLINNFYLSFKYEAYHRPSKWKRVTRILKDAKESKDPEEFEQWYWAVFAYKPEEYNKAEYLDMLLSVDGFYKTGELK